VRWTTLLHEPRGNGVLPLDDDRLTAMSKKRSSEWLRGAKHGARAAAENAVKYGRSFAERGLRDLQANVRRGHDIEDFDRGYTHAYAATLKEPMSVLQELGRPLTKAELDRDIQEALARKPAR